MIHLISRHILPARISYMTKFNANLMRNSHIERAPWKMKPKYLTNSNVCSQQTSTNVSLMKFFFAANINHTPVEILPETSLRHSKRYSCWRKKEFYNHFPSGLRSRLLPQKSIAYVCSNSLQTIAVHPSSKEKQLSSTKCVTWLLDSVQDMNMTEEILSGLMEYKMIRESSKLVSMTQIRPRKSKSGIDPKSQIVTKSRLQYDGDFKANNLSDVIYCLLIISISKWEW